MNGILKHWGVVIRIYDINENPTWYIIETLKKESQLNDKENYF